MNLGNVQDLIAKAEEQIKKIGSIDKWKGNRPPATEHFPPESIKATAGLLAEEQKVWVKFDFEEDGVAHSVKAVMNIAEAGQHGGDDVITYDGQDVENDDEVQGVRAGLEGLSLYARAIFTFKFTLNGTQHELRFDGG